MTEPVLSEAIGVIDGVNDTFYTSQLFRSGTVHVYLNGQLIDKDDYDGFVEIGHSQVRHNIPPLVGDRIYYYFHKLESVSSDIVEPPEIYEIIEVIPEMHDAVDVKPIIIDAVDETFVYDLPTMQGNIDVKPRIERVINLRPRMISIEEI